MKEVDFLIDALRLEPGAMALDVGCGAGRHAVELARRGYRVTGVDISDGQLGEARKTADAAGVAMELIQSDVSQSLPEGKWDAAYCVCEGGFGLLGSKDNPLEHDLQILRNVRSTLAPGGMFMLTCLSVLRFARTHGPEDVESGLIDTETLSEKSVMSAGDDGNREIWNVRERTFSPTEVGLMLQIAGFEVDHIGGGTAGRWAKRPLELDEHEIMAIAHAI